MSKSIYKVDSKLDSKLGRNPLSKMGEKKERTLPALDIVQATQKIPFIEKIKELQIQVDWDELYQVAIESKIKQISRFFLRF